jgi:4-hydroxybenzoate polyprenyltransferase
MKLWTVIVMVMMAEFGLHYFPWRVLLKGKELPRVVAYTLGTLAMMGPLTAWLWAHGEMEIIETLWTVIFTAGVTVLALYGLDRFLKLEMKDMESSEREALYRKQHDGAQS